MSTPSKLGAFLRSSVAGGAATAADLLVLFLGVTCFGLSARTASFPALVAGGVVSFFGNRHFAFRASSGDLGRQAALYTVTELVALGLNAVLYDAVVRAAHPAALGALLIRLVTTNLVFIAWSFPVWRKVFTTEGQGQSQGASA